MTASRYLTLQTLPILSQKLTACTDAQELNGASDITVFESGNKRYAAVTLYHRMTPAD